MTPKFLALILIFSSCGKGDADKTPTSNPPSKSSASEISDTSIEGITAFLQNGTYKGWAAEPVVHDSSGPHGKVRSFFNSILADSLKAKSSTHPVGSIAVKELYSSDGTTLKGYALEAKLEEGQGGNGWLWYEGFSPKFNEYYGQGLSTCTGCHAGGSDFVTSAPP